MNNLALMSYFIKKERTEIIVPYIEPAFLSSIDRLHAPVVYDIIYKVNSSSVAEKVVVPVETRVVETWVAAAVVGEQIVVEGYISSAPDATISMFAFVVNR